MNIMRFCEGLKMAVPLGCLGDFCGLSETCTASGDVSRRRFLVQTVQLDGLVLVAIAQFGQLIFHAAIAAPQGRHHE